jgi:hypothetical protein
MHARAQRPNGLRPHPPANRPWAALAAGCPGAPAHRPDAPPGLPATWLGPGDAPASWSSSRPAPRRPTCPSPRCPATGHQDGEGAPRAPPTQPASPELPEPPEPPTQTIRKPETRRQHPPPHPTPPRPWATTEKAAGPAPARPAPPAACPTTPTVAPAPVGGASSGSPSALHHAAPWQLTAVPPTSSSPAPIHRCTQSRHLRPRAPPAKAGPPHRPSEG